MELQEAGTTTETSTSGGLWCVKQPGWYCAKTTSKNEEKVCAVWLFQAFHGLMGSLAKKESQ